MAAWNPEISALAHELRRRSVVRDSSERGSTGVPALDRLLPGQGLPIGGLTEWISGSADGGFTFALLAARQALTRRPAAALAIIDREHQFFPAPLPGWGIPLQRVVLIRPHSPQEALWAWEQCLRSRGLAACLGWLAEASSLSLRRLQVAAEHGGGQGLLVRPLRVAKESSWADVRWRVTPAPLPHLEAGAWPFRGRRFRVELLRCRHQISGGVADVEFSPHDANPLPVVPPVADPAPPLRPTGTEHSPAGHLRQHPPR
jgi:protein ImuA